MRCAVAGAVPATSERSQPARRFIRPARKRPVTRRCPHSPLESSASLRASSSLQSPRLNRTLAPLHPEGSMVGITSYNTYIPMLRLLLATVVGGKGVIPETSCGMWGEDGPIVDTTGV